MAPASAPVSPSTWRSSLPAGAIALAAYLVLAPAVTGDKDAAEFTLVLGTGGVAHPPGYPLFTLLGHPFVTLLRALGATWAWAANAWCALGGAVAVMLLHRLARRLTDGTGTAPRLAALLAWAPVLLFALNPIWTDETTLAGTGSWHVAWAAGAALLALRLLEALAGGAEPDAAALRRGALAWGLVCGAGMAHHLTSLLLLAPLTSALGRAAGRRRLTAGVLAGFAAGAALPLASYGWVAWRAFHPVPAQWPLLAPSWRAVWDHVTAARYRGYVGGFDPSPVEAGHLARFAYPFLLLAAVALPLAIRGARQGPRRPLLIAIAVWCALQLAVVVVYGVPDPGSYLLPVLGLGLAVAAPAAAGRSRPVAGGAGPGARVEPPRGARWRLTGVTPTLLLVAVALVLLNGSWAWTNWERRGQYRRHDALLRRMWESVTIDRGFVLWHSDSMRRLQVWQELDGEKPGLVVVNPAQLACPWPRRQFTARFGFDPLQGVASGAGAPGAAGQAADDGIIERINTVSDLPVVVFRFDESGPSMIMLNKPEAPAGDSAR